MNNFKTYIKQLWNYHGNFTADIRALRSACRRNIPVSEAKLTWPSTRQKNLALFTFLPSAMENAIPEVA